MPNQSIDQQILNEIRALFDTFALLKIPSEFINQKKFLN